jgi:hypothetical protein
VPPGGNPTAVNIIIFIIIIVVVVVDQESRFHSAKTLQTRYHHLTQDPISDEFTAT